MENSKRKKLDRQEGTEWVIAAKKKKCISVDGSQIPDKSKEK